MKTTTDFVSEWQTSKEKQRVIKLKLETLKNRVNRLTEEEITKLRIEKDKLKKQRSNLYETCKDYANNIYVRESMMNNCRLVLHKTHPNSELIRIRDKFFEDVDRKEKRKQRFSRVTEHLIDDMRKSITMPLHEILQYFAKQNKDDNQRMEDTSKLGEQVNTAIGQIEANFRQTKNSLKQEVRGMESVVETEIARCRADELEWITQSRQHLLLALQEEPSYKSDALKLYKKRWPNDDLSDTPYAQTPMVSQPASLPRHIRKQISVTQEVETQNDAEEFKPWEFFIVANANDKGDKISSRREEFLAKIPPYLPNNVRSFKLGALYKKLLGLTQMDMHQRQLSITKIIDRKFNG